MAVLVDNPSSGRGPHREWGGGVSQMAGRASWWILDGDYGSMRFRRRRIFGGVIAPGLGFRRKRCSPAQSRLPRVEIKDPGKVIGTNTVTHMQAGLYYGAVDMVDGMLRG